MSDSTDRQARTRVVNCRRHSYDVYIGRGSKWGNPYTHLSLGATKALYRVPTREAAIAAFREYLLGDSALLGALPELKGKVLGCYCHPLPCHGDVLAMMADECVPIGMRKGEWIRRNG